MAERNHSRSRKLCYKDIRYSIVRFTNLIYAHCPVPRPHSAYNQTIGLNPPKPDSVKRVSIAVVMYRHSLAIYMNGITQELLSSSGHAVDDRRSQFPCSPLKGTTISVNSRSCLSVEHEASHVPFGSTSSPAPRRGINAYSSQKRSIAKDRPPQRTWWKKRFPKAAQRSKHIPTQSPNRIPPRPS